MSRLRRACALLPFLALACHAEVVDRIVAVVNRKVILQSELDQAARMELLLQGKTLDPAIQPDPAPVLERMIDRALIEQQMRMEDGVTPPPEEITVRIRAIRGQLTATGSDDEWRALLSRNGLTEPDLAEAVTSELRILRFIDSRFRNLVRLDKNAVVKYYEDTFLPQLRAQHSPEPSLADVSDKINRILTERRIDEMLNTWLQTLRSQAQIQRMLPASASTRGTGE